MADHIIVRQFVVTRLASMRTFDFAGGAFWEINRFNEAHILGFPTQGQAKWHRYVCRNDLFSSSAREDVWWLIHNLAASLGVNNGITNHRDYHLIYLPASNRPTV
ncbi:uncharacterized protein LOC107266988 [Cephus cinctus]|uniref:Uncharacterized protein LOC107266988 n=1 Tax=Cephus cinctus TaxID=211228 RepID=A0AAJ7FIK9_CEPCN|nr:uncharacterized protein LOC107266988 [Cephus cinctus]